MVESIYTDIIIFKLDAIAERPKKVKHTRIHTHAYKETNVHVSKFDMFSGTTCEISWSKHFNHTNTQRDTETRTERERERAK